MAKNDDVNKTVERYLQDNPDIKRALKLFNMSKLDYEKSVAAKQGKKLKISTRTTQDGNMGRN